MPVQPEGKKITEEIYALCREKVSEGDLILNFIITTNLLFVID